MGLLGLDPDVTFSTIQTRSRRSNQLSQELAQNDGNIIKRVPSQFNSLKMPLSYDLWAFVIMSLLYELCIFWGDPLKGIERGNFWSKTSRTLNRSFGFSNFEIRTSSPSNWSAKVTVLLPMPRLRQCHSVMVKVILCHKLNIICEVNK